MKNLKDMKKRALAVISALMLIVAMTGCGTQGSGQADSGTHIKVGIAAPNATHGWVAGAAYYAEKYCKEENIEYKITTSADAAEMMANLNDLEQWGANVIVAYPQWTGMETAVSELIDNGITVVNFDIDIDSDGVYKVTGDNYGMGYESAKYIVSRAGEAASVAVMDVPTSGSVSELRKKGFYDYLNEIGYDTANVFEVSCKGFTRDEGLRVMTDVLESHAGIDAVFSIDDELSIGIVQAITEAGRTDIKAVTGGGGMQEYFGMINDEAYEAMGLSSALYSPAMVVDAVKTGIRIENGEECDSVVTIPTTIVTAENVGEYIDSQNAIY